MTDTAYKPFGCCGRILEFWLNLKVVYFLFHVKFSSNAFFLFLAFCICYDIFTTDGSENCLHKPSHFYSKSSLLRNSCNNISKFVNAISEFLIKINCALVNKTASLSLLYRLVFVSILFSV